MKHINHILEFKSVTKTSPGHRTSAVKTCRRTLEGWYRGEKRSMKFAVPRIWREPTDHVLNCYFCIVDPSSRKSGKKGDEIKYPDIPSSIAPVKHSDDLPVPNPPARAGTSKNMEDVNVCDFEDEGDSDFEVGMEEEGNKPHFPNQQDLNDLIRDLSLLNQTLNL